MATWPTALSPQYVTPYQVGSQDATVIEDFGGPEQRYYHAIRIAGTAEGGTGDTDLVDTGAFAGYTSAGLQLCRISVIAQDSYYAISSKTDDDNLVISLIYGDGGFTNTDPYRIMLMKLGFTLHFNALSAAEHAAMRAWWMFHGKFETFTWTDRIENEGYTVRFNAEPTFLYKEPGIFGATVEFIEVI